MTNQFQTPGKDPATDDGPIPWESRETQCPYCITDTGGNHQSGCPNGPHQETQTITVPLNTPHQPAEPVESKAKKAILPPLDTFTKMLETWVDGPVEPPERTMPEPPQPADTECPRCAESRNTASMMTVANELNVEAVELFKKALAKAEKRV